MGKYAANTAVTMDQSRAEIERILRRHGADQFLSGWAHDQVTIAFRMRGKMIRFVAPLPARNDPAFTRTPAGRIRSSNQSAIAYEQAVRQRWRALALNIKAKLAAVEDGISTFESEFMARIVLPNGKTLEETVLPMIERAYETGTMPDLLPHLSVTE